MAAGFRTRRIKSETSIGDRLKRARTRQKVTVSEVEEQTKIRAKFILALESDSWEHIPSEVYGRGYLETYALFLKLPVDEIMNDYDKMRTLYARLCQQGVPEFAPRASLKLPRFVLTPRFIVGTGVALALLLFAGFIGTEVAGYVGAPNLHIISPVEAAGVDSSSPQLVVNTNTVTVQGTTSPDAILKVDNEVVAVKNDGSFSTAVAVEKGLNTIKVEAVGKTGKPSTELLEVYVK